MKKARNTAEILGSDDELDYMELPEGEGQERTLVLKVEPRPRRIQLMAQGAKEIRCICCHRIRPLAGAEECDEGWICEECVPGLKGRY
jgi:LSD1 subclass zinc finger protein